MRVAIANRAEVAVRIIRACEELGHTSILLHSTPDKENLAYKLADEVTELSGDTAAETYLDIDKVIAASRRAKADMLHPGFGFLSESAAFAKAVTDAGITFVGPSANAIQAVGDKVEARKLAEKAKVPVIPAFDQPDASDAELTKAAKKIGFPVMIKAVAGGGGKGIKVVHREAEFSHALASARREAKAGFADDRIYLEKFLENPRHVEVQLLADHHGHVIHLYERECSVQRRFQKIFEESPAPGLHAKLREVITQDAIKIAKSVGYTNAGTAEFLVDAKGNHYFLELNARLQVEHPVTELACGMDLVSWQFAIASGEKLTLKQEDIQIRGHSIEARIYAEDPSNQFLPSTGELLELYLPHGPHRRFDFGYHKGDQVTGNYDPMLGKIITWAPTREENLWRMLATLRETIIFGVQTNIEFLKVVLENQRFKKGELTTQFLDEAFPNGFMVPELTAEQLSFAEGIHAPTKATRKSAGLSYVSPWSES